MITGNTEMNNPALTSTPENNAVFRNDILLPKKPFSYIVVYERGLRSSPESPLFTLRSLATANTPPAF